MSALNNKILIQLILGLLLALFTVSTLQAQNKKELEAKKESLKKDIDYKNQLLEETTKNKKSSLNQLVIINKKIKEREELIATIKNEITLMGKEIQENTSSINALEKDIELLKEEYAEMIRFAYKSKNNLNKLLFIFAAEDFNQAYKRIRYLQQYSDYRTEQVATIRSKEESLRQRNEVLVNQRSQKEKLLSSEDRERLNLAGEKKQQNKVYGELQQKERELRAEIDRKEKERKALQKAIEKIIEEAMRASSKSSKATKFVLTPEAKALAQNFATNKGKLPWPVKEGVIIESFGINYHPVLKEVKTRNDGITFETKAGAEVRAVFDGEVSQIIRIPNYGKVVMLRHGDFITAYGNLKDILVRVGDKVTTKQPLGTVLVQNGKSQFEFQLRQSLDLLNPEYWLFEAK